MKIKCNETISIARTDDRSKPNVQLYRDKVMDVIDEIASTAIRLGFAVKCDEPQANEKKMVEQTHQNKMVEEVHKNKSNENKKGKKAFK